MKPILYNFRRCPYCIRARYALLKAGIDFELREILIRDKPKHMLEISPKGTVPVLLLPDETVIDESIDVMYWAIEQNDPEAWLTTPKEDVLNFVKKVDTDFAAAVTRYKYPDRYEGVTAETGRNEACAFLAPLEEHISKKGAVLGDSQSLADIAILPLIRQFAKVDQEWFDVQESLAAIRKWLTSFTDSAFFEEVMARYDVWEEE